MATPKKKPEDLLEGGRPPIWEDPEKLAQAVEDYFIDGITLRTFLVGKPPNQQAVTLAIPTITGLCLYLGFESRQSFYDYEKRPGFSYVIKKARLRIEHQYEEQLNAGNTVGAIFALKNMNWTDRQDVNLNGEIKVTPITGMEIK